MGTAADAHYPHDKRLPPGLSLTSYKSYARGYARMGRNEETPNILKRISLLLSRPKVLKVRLNKNDKKLEKQRTYVPAPFADEYRYHGIINPDRISVE